MNAERNSAEGDESAPRESEFAGPEASGDAPALAVVPDPDAREPGWTSDWKGREPQPEVPSYYIQTQEQAGLVTNCVYDPDGNFVREWMEEPSDDAHVVERPPDGA